MIKLGEELPSLPPLTARHWFFIIQIFEQLSCPGKQSLPWKCSLHWNKDFWVTCACSKNRVFPENFHCIEYSFYIQDFWATCACPEKQSVPWIHCIEYIFFIIQNFEQPTLEKQNLEFFTVLKYILSFRIFEQLVLALKTEIALNFSSRWGRSPSPLPASYATGRVNIQVYLIVRFVQQGFIYRFGRDPRRFQLLFLSDADKQWWVWDWGGPRQD